MGRLFYGARGVRVDMDDRLLEHVFAVTAAKLLRGESFFLSWTESPEHGSGRRTVYLHSGCDLSWEWDGNRSPTIDEALIERLTAAAHTSTGIDLRQHAHNPRPAQKSSPVS